MKRIQRTRDFGVFFITILIFLSFPAPAASQKTSSPDDTCLACHGQAGMLSSTGKSIYINPAKHAAGAHSVLGCTDCHTDIKDYPHPAKIVKVQCSTCHADEASAMAGSVHSVLGDNSCGTCHGNVHDLKTAEHLAPAKCAECHEQEIKDFDASIHGQAQKRGDPDAPNCFSCHGPVHSILASDDPASLVSKQKQPDTCASCHSNPGFLSRHNIPLAHLVEFYKQSVHARAIAAGNLKAAVCSDCHSSHSILPARDAKSTINHWNVAATCGKCHSQIEKTYMASVHGQAMLAGVRDTPVCTDCHGEHLILSPNNAESPVSAAQVSTVTCGRCHGDAALAKRFNLPADRVPSYADSYHGLAMREGSQTVANCASCHGVHNIFPASDPRSTINPANLAKTCGHCHQGAGEYFAIGQVHVNIDGGSAGPAVRWIRWTYWFLIPLTLAFMLLHNFLDFFKKLRRGRQFHAGTKQFVRMNLPFRIAHWGVTLSFPVLVVTGFALRYPGQFWAQPVLLWESHFAFRGTVHRIAAVVLIVSTLYHVMQLIISKRDRAAFKAMLPKLGDASEMVAVFMYNLGLSKKPPTFGRFNYAEKIEYWAFAWGMLVMTITGCLLWFTNFTLRYFPKWVTDAATAVHFYEAVLATLSILVWHMYMVVFDPDVYPMETAWITGNAALDHYETTRPEYIKGELAGQEPAEKPAAAEANTAASKEAPADEKDDSGMSDSNTT
jgi:formate dehydrogenase gamma subunit